MNKINSIKLDNETISEIKEILPFQKINTPSPLFYEGQIPNVAYLLIEGTIELLKNKKIKKKLKPGHLIGLNELMSNTPSQLTANAQAESVLCYLDKSTVIDMIKDDQTSLSHFLKKEIE